MTMLPTGNDVPLISRRGALGALGALGAAAAMPGVARAQDKAPGAMPPAAPSLPNGSGFYRFPVGDIEIAVIGDGNGSMAPHPLFGADRTKEEVEATLKGDFLPPEQIAMTFNVPLLRTPSGVVLIDTGNGHKSRPNSGRLVEHMANLGVKPADVVAVILTHMHGDHFGGLTDAQGNLTFPNAKYYLHRVEYVFWNGAAPDLSGSLLPAEWKPGFIASAAAALKAIESKLEFTDDGTKIVPGVTVEVCPGHTPGHQMVHIASGSSEVLMIADCVHHHSLSLRHPSWHAAFDYDAKKGAATRAKMLDRLASDRTLALSYHMPFPGLGHVRKDGEGYEWVPTAWKW